MSDKDLISLIILDEILKINNKTNNKPMIKSGGAFLNLALLANSLAIIAATNIVLPAIASTLYAARPIGQHVGGFTAKHLAPVITGNEILNLQLADYYNHLADIANIKLNKAIKEKEKAIK